MALTCVIVDDDPMSVKVLEALVKSTDLLDLIESFQDPVQAASSLAKKEVDILFLDIEMPQMSGFDLLSILSPKPEIIMVSHKEKYALDAFDYEVAAYLLKPVNPNKFIRAVLKAQKNLSSRKELKGDNIFIKVDSLLLNFKYSEILWVEGFGDYVKVKTEQKHYTVYATMKYIEEKLPSSDFVRIHRSYIVNLSKIKNIDSKSLVIRDQVFPISDKYKESFKIKIRTL